MVLSAFLLPVFVCGTAFFINFIAMYYHASRAIPIGTMVSDSKIANLVYFRHPCHNCQSLTCYTPLSAIRLFPRFCKMFYESVSVVMQLPC